MKIYTDHIEMPIKIIVKKLADVNISVKILPNRELDLQLLPDVEFGFPVTTLENIVILSGRYPTEQEFYDYLDVPDGVLNAERRPDPITLIQVECACGKK